MKQNATVKTSYEIGGGRNSTYDWLRIIATLFVVIGHASYLKITTTYGGVSYELPDMVNEAYNGLILSFIRILSGWVYQFHMPLFFMLSGAVLALKPIPAFDKFVNGKIKRLLIPFFFYGCIFMLPIKYLGDFYDNPGLIRAMNGFLSGADSGHLWFLTALFWCLITFAALEKLLKKVKVNSHYILLFVCGIISFTYDYLPFDVLGLKTGLGYIFWLSFGYVFEKEKGNYCWNVRQMLLAFVVIFLLEVTAMKYNILNSFFQIVMGSLLCYLLATFCSRVFLGVEKCKWWKKIGTISFSIYLLHDPLEYLVLKLFLNSHMLETGAGCYLYVFSRIVIVIIVSILLGEIISCVKNKLGIILSYKPKSLK